MHRARRALPLAGKFFVPVVGSILVIGGLIGASGVISRPESPSSNRASTTAQRASELKLERSRLSVVDQAGEQREYEFVFEVGQSAEFALIELDKSMDDFSIEYGEFSFGKYVAAVNGLKPDAKVAFWKLQINGQDAQVGVSDYQLQQGDSLNLIYEAIE